MQTLYMVYHYLLANVYTIHHDLVQNFLEVQPLFNVKLLYVAICAF